MRDKNADDVTIALFVNNPLTVAGIDAEDDNEGFEAVALFVSAEEGDTKGLTDEVKESTEFVGAADIDDATVFEDVCDPSSIVEESIDVELAECVTVNVAKDDTEVKLDTDGNAVPEVETEFNAVTVGKFVPLAVSVIVEIRVVNGEEEVRTVDVSKIVTV